MLHSLHKHFSSAAIFPHLIQILMLGGREQRVTFLEKTLGLYYGKFQLLTICINYIDT